MSTGSSLPRATLVLGLVAAFPAAARADAPQPQGDTHLAYGSDCGTAQAIRVVVDATAKGPKVTVTRGGASPGPYETLDVSFAHVSRRLFFKARTSDGLIEFQGHARPNALSGMLSDDYGRTRQIILPSAPAGTPGCGPKDHR